MDKKTFLYTKYTFKKFKHKKHKNTNTAQSPGMYVFMTNLGVIITACEIRTKTHDKYKSKVNMCLFCVLYYSPLERIKWAKLIHWKRRKCCKRLKVILDQPKGVLLSKIHT